jgi:sec-independent protein translocase protein TatA
MPNVGPLELVVVLIIALVVLGPKRLPEVGRSLGNGIREFKESLTMDHSDDDHLDVEDVEEPPKALATTAATAPVAPAAEAAETADQADPDEADKQS